MGTHGCFEYETKQGRLTNGCDVRLNEVTEGTIAVADLSASLVQRSD